MNVIRNYFFKYLDNEQALFILAVFTLLSTFGYLAPTVFTPLLISIVISFMVHNIVQAISTLFRIKNSFFLVYAFFMALYLILLGYVIPLITKQFMSLLNEIPRFISLFEADSELKKLIHNNYVTTKIFYILSKSIENFFENIADNLLTVSANSLGSVASFFMYFFLVPFYVFFLVKDKKIILEWFEKFLPTRNAQLRRLWGEIHKQLNILLKILFLQATLMFLLSMTLFNFLNLNYFVLLGFAVGLGILVPVVGIIFVSIPVALVAWSQFGISMKLFWVLFSYFCLHFVDANLITPFLYSGPVSIHPLVIMFSIVLFGYHFGFWGVFLALPLASIINCLILYWPSHQKITEEQHESA